MVLGDLGALGFWIFVASLVVGGMWKESRHNAEKHETLRRIVEKTGEIDEARLKELFKEESSEEWKPGAGYRALRVSGAITMFSGAGLAAFFLIAAGLGKVFGEALEWWYGGLAISAGITMLGLGIFFSSRFAEPPAR